jgi:hypothetical protein
VNEGGCGGQHRRRRRSRRSITPDSRDRSHPPQSVATRIQHSFLHLPLLLFFFFCGLWRSGRGINMSQSKRRRRRRRCPRGEMSGRRRRRRRSRCLRSRRGSRPSTPVYANGYNRGWTRKETRIQGSRRAAPAGSTAWPSFPHVQSNFVGRYPRSHLRGLLRREHHRRRRDVDDMSQVL